MPYEGLDPFRFYSDFPVRTYSSTLSSEVIKVRPESIIGHFACFRMSSDKVAVLSLSLVSAGTQRKASRPNTNSTRRIERFSRQAVMRGATPQGFSRRMSSSLHRLTCQIEFFRVIPS